MLQATQSKTATSNESALIHSAQKGDKQAYHALYNMHLPMVYGLACRLVNDVSAAEDVSQEAFIRAWHSLNSFKGESLFSSWLHRVASNSAIDYLRKQRSWIQLVFNHETLPEAKQKDLLAEKYDLENLLHQLPERARIVFVLHTIEGYRHEEIAEMTKMAIGSSKAQLHRAKALLKKWMSDD